MPSQFDAADVPNTDLGVKPSTTARFASTDGEPQARASWFHLVVLFATTCALSFVGGLVFKSFFPRASHSYPLVAFEQAPDVKFITTTRLPPPPTVPPESHSGWEVYFSNGSSDLSNEQRDWLVKLSRSLKQCSALELVLTGSVSSAAFKKNSGERNLELANARASSVGQILVSELPSNGVKVSTWATFPELETKRLFRDSRDSSEIENPVEFLNRRVDIVLGKETRCPFLVTTTNAPGTSTAVTPPSPAPKVSPGSKVRVGD